MTQPSYHRQTRGCQQDEHREATWLQPPPRELAETLSYVFGVHGELLSADAWRELLVRAGLQDVTAISYKAESMSNRRDDLADVLRTLPRMVTMAATSPSFRHFIKMSTSLPKDFLEYFGYGLYVGTK
jgi:hypothetical protein